MAIEIEKYDDLIDSRDVGERITELKAQRNRAKRDADIFATGDERELESLQELDKEGKNAFGSEWTEGVTLVRDSYFEDYARELAEDITDMRSVPGWPYDHIDWTGAAEALQMDYVSVEFDGVEYWGRA